jgi:carboxypeptidase PM20D1
MIGLAEKGYADIRITATDEGGHAAEPPAHTALGKLAAAIAAIESAPMKQRLIAPATRTFDALGRHMGLHKRIVLANMWLFKPLVLAVMAWDKQTNAMTRTTIAATMAEAGTAPNVLPQRASAVLNVRYLPGETAEGVKAHIERAAANAGVALEVEVLKDSPPVETRESSWAYGALLRCLPAIRAGIIPAPYLVTGATDSREYSHIADEIYRFYPFILNTAELDAMHATDERVRIDSLAGALRFNYHFIKEAVTRSE